MASIPEDVHDDRDILSMTDLLALKDSIPPEQFYPNALLNQFDSKLAFGDTKSKMEERAQRATTLLAISAAKRASPTCSRGRPSAPRHATHGSPSAIYLNGGFTSDATLGSLPAAGEGIIPHFPSYEERDRTVSCKENLAEHSYSNSIDSPNTPPTVMEQPTRDRAFQSPSKLSASCTSAREAVDKKDRNPNSIKKKNKEDELIPNALKMDNKFKVACSVASLLIFFHDKDFKGAHSVFKKTFFYIVMHSLA
jgi:hypothetical protein